MTTQFVKVAPEEPRQKIKEPEKNEINVSTKRDPKSYKILCKLVLRKFDHLVLRGIGFASQSVVQIAESMVRSELAVIEKIESGMIDLEDLKNETGTKQGVLFTVKLGKGKRFDELTKNLE